MQRPYLTTAQAAEMLNLTQDYVRHLLRSKKLKGFQKGSWKIPTSSIIEYVEQ